MTQSSHTFFEGKKNDNARKKKVPSFTKRSWGYAPHREFANAIGRAFSIPLEHICTKVQLEDIYLFISRRDKGQKNKEGIYRVVKSLTGPPRLFETVWSAGKMRFTSKWCTKVPSQSTLYGFLNPKQVVKYLTILRWRFCFLCLIYNNNNKKWYRLNIQHSYTRLSKNNVPLIKAQLFSFLLLLKTRYLSSLVQDYQSERQRGYLIKALKN